MKTVVKILGILLVLISLNGCSGGYYSYSTYPGRYYSSPFYTPYPSGPYYRGFYPGYAYPGGAPHYHSSPNSSTMTPSHPGNAGTGMPGRRR